MAWALVTGGAKNLGAEICRSLAAKGYNVVVHYHESEKEALQVVEECRQFGVKAESISGNFSDRASVMEFVQRYMHRFSDTKILVNNVGNYYLGSALNTSLSIWEELFQTNFFASLALIQSLMPSIKKNRGSIINIGVAGLEKKRADTYSTAYSLTKECLLSLTRSLAREVAKDHVRVNMVSPGYLDYGVDVPKDLEKIPMSRTAEASEVARVVAFLLEDQSEYITGQNIEVAGGVRL